MNWYVLYTKPQSELRAVKELEKLGLEVYCPVTTEVKQWSDRKKQITSPLFKSYIFIRLPEAERNLALQASSVVRYLFWLGKPAVVREEEIATIKEWLESSKYQEVQVHNLAPGEKVNIHNGAFKGQAGIVEAVDKRKITLVLKSLNVKVTTKVGDVL